MIIRPEAAKAVWTGGGKIAVNAVITANAKHAACAEPLPIVESYSHRGVPHGRNSDGADVVRQHESDIIEDVSVHFVELNRR
jgi:hypothetical protein